MGADAEQAIERRGWSDYRISLWLNFLAYAVSGIGIALGFYYLSRGDSLNALHWAAPFMVGGVGILAMIRHSVFFRSDTARVGVKTEPFFLIELGFANGALGILSLVAFFASWGVAAEVALALTYALYLAMAYCLFSAKARKSPLNPAKIIGLVFWPVQVGLLAWFAIAAAVEARI